MKIVIYIKLNVGMPEQYLVTFCCNTCLKPDLRLYFVKTDVIQLCKDKTVHLLVYHYNSLPMASVGSCMYVTGIVKGSVVSHCLL